MFIDFFFGKQQRYEDDKDFILFPVNPEGAREGTISFSFPVADIHSYWTGEKTAPADQLQWSIEFMTATQRGIPFITFFNTGGINRLSAGLADLNCDLKISAKMNQATCSYDVTFFMKGEEALPEFSFLIDRREQSWQTSIAEWRKVQHTVGYSFPEEVWNPVYCTWYAVHGAVTQDWCEKTAAEVSKSGFGTFILDDGWCYPDMKRVTPESLSTWYEKIGEWCFDPVKFPDARAHIRRIQKMGLKYLVWVAPFLIGEKSSTYQELHNVHGALFGEYHEGHYRLDPWNAKGCGFILDKMERLITEYGVDGLKVDFLDEIKPDKETPRSGSCLNFIRELSGRIRKHKPDALIEFRQSYAVPQMLAYGTQFRAMDCPFDFLLNFRRIAQIRLTVGDGIPVHADPAYWPQTELPVNIARHFIAMMGAVPMLSIDFQSLSEEAKQIISFWIGFYRKHAGWLKNAHWEMDYSNGQLACSIAEGKNDFLAIVADSKRVPERFSHGWILNLSSDPIPLSGNVRVFDLHGKTLCGNVIPPGGGAEKNEAAFFESYGEKPENRDFH